MTIETPLNQEQIRQLYFEHKQADDSGTHSFSHVRNVAELASITGHIAGFNPRAISLGVTAALFHDFIRYKTESGEADDEERSGEAIYDILTQENQHQKIATSEYERDIIRSVITHQSEYPIFLEEPQTREIVPNTLKDQLHLMVFTGDKLEANGVRGIARRCAFVAGERLQNSQGDLQQFGFRPQRNEAVVVAIESAIRLSIINPEDIYPTYLSPLVGRLYEQQRNFVAGIFNGINFNADLLAELILETKRPDGKNILQARRLSAPDSVLDLANLIKDRGGLTDELVDTPLPDLVTASFEALDHFSSHYKEDIDQSMLKWNPRSLIGQGWKQEMKDYTDGIWFSRLRAELGIDNG